ncbi:MAG TPA: PqqD family protein [Thermoanaerobaculia bacterium]|nr:PqqD family protein [Thermoanaerobaculia bacterium]
MSPGQGSLRISDHVQYTKVEGDYVLLDLGSGEYFGLDEVASLAWEVLAAGGDQDAAVAAIVRDYAVEPDRAAADVARLLDTLRDKGLIEGG